jgi:oxalate decarboxylase
VGVVSKTIAAAHVILKPGGLREMHWHPNADEWQYYIKGKGRMTVFTGGAKARTMDFQAGDVGYIQNTLPHFIENTGDTDLEFLETFKSDVYQDLSLTEWISHLPPQLVSAHLKIDPTVVESLPRGKPVVVPV